LDATIRIIEIIIGVGLLIMIHELGHFLACKWLGVRVDKFAIGMGPKLFWFRRRETEYSVRVIPFGGFVLMAGEEPGSTTDAPPERQFRHQRPGRKALILFAGVAMNFVLAVVMFTIALGVGLYFTRPYVGTVLPESPAKQVGIRPGDDIIAVNGDRDVDWVDVKVTIAMTDPGDNVTLTVKRGDQTREFTVTPEKSEGNMGLPVIGIEPASGRTVTKIEPGSPAQAAGFLTGDVIQTMDGMEFYRWPDAFQYLSVRVGKTVTVSVKREGEPKPLALEIMPRAAMRGSVGLVPKNFPKVDAVTAGSPAERGGVKAHDEILAIDGRPTPTIAVAAAIAARNTGKPLVYTIRREGKTLNLPLTPEIDPDSHRGVVGVRLEPVEDWTVGEVAPGSPAAAAGIRPGDVLTHVAGKSVAKSYWDGFQEVLDALAKTEKPAVTLVWRSGESVKQEKLTVNVAWDPLIADVGLSLNPWIRRFRKYPLHEAPVVGLKKSWRLVQQIYLFLRGVLTRRMSPKWAAGPVGIVQISYQQASEGVTKLVYWLAILSVNLVVVNLLPMPPLDGGLLILAGLEKIRGRALDEKWLLRLQLAGWAVVIILVLMITFNDIRRLLG